MGLRFSMRGGNACMYYLTLILLLATAGKKVLAAPGDNKLPPTSYTIFQTSDVPVNALTNDGGGIEVGVKIRCTEAGIVTAIRYYKGVGTTGTHLGHIWTSGGTMLTEATFTGETASGWQQVMLENPVYLDTGVTYIASFHNPAGDYAYTSSYFSGTVGSGPIKALAAGIDGVNGIYSYSGSPVLPTSSFNSSNYFVDVVFVPLSAGTVISGALNYIPKFTSVASLGNSQLYDNGIVVGIGTTSLADTNYRLIVERGIRTRRVRVDQASWPDYVFNSRYELPTIAQVDQFIKKHQHLPGVPSADQIHKEGLDIGEGQAVLLKKIEELTLYIIELKNQMNAQKKRIDKLEKRR